MTTAAELRTEYRQALLAATSDKLPHQTIVELLRGLDVLLGVTMDECRAASQSAAEGGGATKWLMKNPDDRIRLRKHTYTQSIVAEALDGNFCGYGLTVEAALADAVSRLRGAGGK